jgi:hypothetical protein
MLELPISASQEEVLEEVNKWVKALCDDDYEQACEFLHWPEWSQEWSVELIRKLITNYGSLEPRRDGQTFRVTDPSLAHGRARHSVPRFPEVSDKVVGHVCYDLPLNGEWSQVTATFDLCRVGGKLTFVLEDIHVL